jgi:protein prenyltransferase alpha subunit repeat containing protein 1
MNLAFELLCEALDKDPDICEVGKSFSQDALVSSYPDHRVAVAASAVPGLYLHAYQSLFELRSQRYRVKGVDAPPHSIQALDKLSKVVLFFNSECATAWNIRSSDIFIPVHYGIRKFPIFPRKELLESDHTSLYVERNICNVVLQSFPKSRETFAHRRWLIQNAMGKLGDQAIVSSKLVDLFMQEQRVCQWCAELARHNYQAWTHRHWIFKHCVNNQIEIFNHLESDLADTEVWLQSHISDYSGMHHRYYVIKYIGDELCSLMPLPGQKSLTNILTADLAIVSSLILSFPGHQALWYYRRSIVHYAVHFSDLSVGNSLDSHCRIDCMSLKAQEEQFINSVLNHSSEGIEDFTQSTLALNYHKWLIAFMQ